jgi:hypothetical protein
MNVSFFRSTCSIMRGKKLSNIPTKEVAEELGGRL